MTLTTPDRVSPAQPPPGGARELLAFAALTASAYLCGALALALVAGLTG